MSKFTKDEQTEIVRWAMNLEAAIQSEQAELSRLMRSRFHSAPAAPTRKVIDQRVKEIKPNYPEKPKVEVDFKEFLAKEAANSPGFFTNLFGTEPLKKGLTITGISIVVTFVLGSLAISGSGSDAGGLFTIFGWLVSFVGSLVSFFSFFGSIAYYLNKRKHWMEEVKRRKMAAENDPGYLNARAEAERAAQEEMDRKARVLKNNQAVLDRKYEKDKKEYELTTLPTYEKEKELWEIEKEIKTSIIADDLASNQQLQKELYDSTKLISVNNRTLPKLIWLYEDMNSTEHDIERATDLLNADLQLAATQNVAQRVDDMNADLRYGFNRLYSELDRGFAQITEQLDLANCNLDDVRKDLRKTKHVASADLIMGSIQRHKSNKMLRSQNEEFLKLSKKFRNI
ncbi:MAG: hypothetical protein IIY22_02595 [Erysipelotrichaceae bacterium]|nr:hypothetical protein [Erysipelotrichaceae bacterium]